MRRLLRDKVSKVYLSKDGTWTPHFSLAKEFQNTPSLIQVATGCAHRNLEMVLMMEDTPSDFDVVLALSRTLSNVPHAAPVRRSRPARKSRVDSWENLTER